VSKKHRIFFEGDEDMDCAAPEVFDEGCDESGTYRLEHPSAGTPDADIYLCPEHKDKAKTEGWAE